MKIRHNLWLSSIYLFIDNINLSFTVRVSFTCDRAASLNLCKDLVRPLLTSAPLPSTGYMKKQIAIYHQAFYYSASYYKLSERNACLHSSPRTSIEYLSTRWPQEQYSCISLLNLIYFPFPFCFYRISKNINKQNDLNKY